MKDGKLFKRFFYELLKSSNDENKFVKKMDKKKKLLLKQNREIRKLRSRQQFQLNQMKKKHSQQLVDLERNN